MSDVLFCRRAVVPCLAVLALVAGTADAKPTAAGAETAKNFPVSQNVKGHENTEWSQGYAFHVRDRFCDLPRVLLIGDSICQSYRDGVINRLEGKVNVTYWVSSFCVTRSGYLRMLEFYLDEARYDVIHFNNGLHSWGADLDEWRAAYDAALTLIRRKQPQAKVIIASCTPLKNAESSARSKRLSEIAREVGVKQGITDCDDLFALLDPLNREVEWHDDFHLNQRGKDLMAEQVAKVVLNALGKRTKN